MFSLWIKGQAYDFLEISFTSTREISDITTHSLCSLVVISDISLVDINYISQKKHRIFLQYTCNSMNMQNNHDFSKQKKSNFRVQFIVYTGLSNCCHESACERVHSFYKLRVAVLSAYCIKPDPSLGEISNAS